MNHRLLLAKQHQRENDPDELRTHDDNFGCTLRLWHPVHLTCWKRLEQEVILNQDLHAIDLNLEVELTVDTIGYIPPAEAEKAFYANLNSLDMVAWNMNKSPSSKPGAFQETAILPHGMWHLNYVIDLINALCTAMAS